MLILNKKLFIVIYFIFKMCYYRIIKIKTCGKKWITKDIEQDLPQVLACFFSWLSAFYFKTMKNIFKKINPLFEYSNKDKQAEKKMIDYLGKEKAEKIAFFAVSIQGESFAPVITSPAQLLNKLSQLIVYAKKKQNNKPVII